MDRKQCALPVLDGLLPKEFQGVVNKLVFSANDWYALAKLRCRRKNWLVHELTKLRSYDDTTNEL